MTYIFLADGFETIEALTTVDVFRRAGLEIMTVGVTSDEIKSSQNITVKCDRTVDEISLMDDIDAIVLPGGMPGTLNLEKNSTVQSFIDFAVENNIIIGAICAAPSILGHKGILKGKKATCYPGFEAELKDAVVTNALVEKDGNIITAKGMGVSLDFALCLTEALKGADTAEMIKRSVQSK